MFLASGREFEGKQSYTLNSLRNYGQPIVLQTNSWYILYMAKYEKALVAREKRLF